MKPKRFKRRVVGFAVLAFVFWLFVLAGLIVAFSRQRSERPSDAAIVLGAAVQNGQPSPVYAARLDHAIDLYQRGIVRNLILTGGVGEGDRVSESEAGAAYAIARDVPSDRILTESVSHTTHQNLVEARRLLSSAGLSTGLLVSDPLHMRRACMMLDNLGMDAQPSPTPHTRYRSLSSQIPFLLREIYFYHHYVFLGQ